MVPVFSSVATNSFGSKSLHCPGLSFNSYFYNSYHSFQTSLSFLVCEGIHNCFIMYDIFRTSLLKELRFTETNNGLDADVFKDVMGWKEALWVTHPMCWSGQEQKVSHLTSLTLGANAAQKAFPAHSGICLLTVICSVSMRC